jgi:parvulin-like peptidyl-prolyl isomerase
MMAFRSYFRRGPWTRWFGVLFLFSLAATVRAQLDAPSTETLQRVLSSIWIEERHYDDLPEHERWGRMGEDFAFDSWLAAQARNEGYRLTENDRAMLDWSRQILENVYLAQALARRETPPSSTVAGMAAAYRWTHPLPERFEVSYLFIDTSHVRSDAERVSLKERAERIKQQLTPENFEAMARMWSDVPSAEQGGNLGLISLESRGPTFSSHVRQTQPGTIGGPWKTRSGWNILYVRRRLPPSQPQFTADQLTSMTAQVLANEKVKALRQSPEQFQEAWKQYASEKEKTIQEEMAWHENFLLMKQYVGNLLKKESPSEEALKALYNERLDRLRLPPRKRAREILLTSDDWTTEPTVEAWLKRRIVRDRAREIRQRIIEGADFAEMARQLSAAPTAPSGGDIGWVQMPSSFLVDTTLAALKPGEISPPMVTQKGYWLAKLEEIEPPRTMTFEEARPGLELTWLAQRRKTILSNLKETWASQPTIAHAPLGSRK